ncbi:hypothetical protein C3L33_09228, partial [Rhododendron williamsianum]
MAATLVGGAFLSGAFNVLLDRLSSPEVIKFFRGRKLDESLLKKLKLTLLELNKVLNDAEEKQITDRAVSKCDTLKSLPLGLFPQLQSLDIVDCVNFETLLIPDGIELNLTSLSIVDCNNMFSFPCGGLPAPNLFSLKLNHCEKLKALPEQMHTLLPSLGKLMLWDCPEIESFPEGGLPFKLGYLYISGCKKLICGRRDWGLKTLPSLEMLCLHGESEDALESFPEEGLLPSTLKHLWLAYMPNLKSLNKRGLGSLGSMVISDCPQLQSLPEEGLPTSLLRLFIWYCPLLKPRCRREEGEDWHKIAHIPYIVIDGETLLIPDGIEVNLRSLYISNCNNMLSFPGGGLPAPKLSCLRLDRCEKLKALPEQMHTLLSSLWKLSLWDCPEIESFPEGGLPSELGSLSIGKCKKLVGGRRDWVLQTLPSLRTLYLCSESEDVSESFPEEGLLPSTLIRLDLGNMPNLKSLNKRGLQHLGSLKTMEIWNLPQLQSLPEEGLPTSLVNLYISTCPLLKPRCRREEGEDWHKIAHIPRIVIDREVIDR